MPSMVCVPLMVDDVAAALDDAAAARDAGADLVEYRVDNLLTGNDPAERRRIGQLPARSPLPCIVTCRPEDEGGHCVADDDARAELFESLLAADRPPRYIDVEHSAIERSTRPADRLFGALAAQPAPDATGRPTSLILSMHDFTGRPANLFRRVAAMQAVGHADVLKVAYLARSLRDNLDLFDILADADRPAIALAMGRFGLMSRILAPKFGGLLTFASLRDTSATAPGQPTIDELLDLYRFRSIGLDTRIYGIVGWPVEHSLSPVLHNFGFDAVGHDGVYLPLPVPPEYEHLKATLGAMLDHPRLDLAGCSVTVPHKQHLVRFAREEIEARRGHWEIDATSDLCAAANTLAVRRDDGHSARHEVSNTDADAAVACLADALGPLDARKIAVFGAGGVARAVVAGLAQAGAGVTVFNRTAANARAIADSLADRVPGRVTVGDAAALTASRYDAYVNCTPVGMTGGPDPDGTPFDPSALTGRAPGAVVFDTVYTPLQTPLLKQAAAVGMGTVDGLCMLTRQAAAQFRTWTGAAAPNGLFDRVAHGSGATP